MKLPQMKQIKWKYSALAFLMPFCGLLLVRLVCTLCFDGTYSMLYSDQYHQYYPFFLAFRNALRSGDSLLYTWSVGMGMDYLGLISYYLASPLNLLSVLVPDSLTLAYFSALMPIKLGLAGLFFAIFLKKIFGKNDFSIAVFGSFYALCAWALGYQWNIMWLDTFALLPLVALGTVSLLRDRKFLLYTITLFLSIFSNYYIGFFTCIFVLLLFICYEICRWQGFKRFIGDLIFIALFSILAIAMTAILELPALAALQTTQSSVNKFPQGFRLNIASTNDWIGLLDAMRQVAGNMNGGLAPTFKEGLPNLYCGVFTNILAFLFITCRRVKLRDKICSVALLIFFNVSFIIRQLDYIWHGFHFTNMIPYRFSFLYSFVMLYMAYRAWLMRRSFRLWQILIALVLSVTLLLFCAQFPGFIDLVSGNTVLAPWDTSVNIMNNLETVGRNCAFVVFTGALLILYAIFLIYGFCWKKYPGRSTKRQRVGYLRRMHLRRQLGSSLIMGAMVLELIMTLVCFGVAFPGTNVVNYPKGKEDTKNVLTYMQVREAGTPFYRVETTQSQTLNDGALNGYNGISTFTSSANVKVTYFMQALGYGAKNTYNRYCFEESSPVANLFLNLKYMLERSDKVEDNAYFKDLYQSGNVHLLENNAYLPLGFLANNQLVNLDFNAQNGKFQFQNELLKAAAGINEDVWRPVDTNNLNITGSGATINSQYSSGYCTYTTQSSDKGTVSYSFTADSDGFMCVALEQSKRNDFSLWLNGEYLYSDSYSLPQMVSVSDVHAGDVVEVKLTCKAGENGNILVSAAILDDAVFRKCHSILNTSTLELTKFSNTKIDGTIQCDRSGVLYTSIPQDGNWTAFIDGEQASLVLIGDAMCGLLLDEGEHTVSFRYENKAFSLGWKISLVALILFIAAYFAFYQPKWSPKKGKYEQQTQK